MTPAVSLVVIQANCATALGQEPAVCQAEAALTVWRSLFGIKTWSPSVGDDLTLRIVAVAGAAAVELKAALLKIPAVARVDVVSAFR